MSVKVLFFASLADVTGMHEAEVDSSAVRDVASVFDQLAGRFPELEAHRRSLLIALNMEFVPPDTPVRDGDEVAFFPPVSGG